jgi:hypothetical protein
MNTTFTARSRRGMLAGVVATVAGPAALAACGAPATAPAGLSQEARPTSLEWFGKLKGIAQADVDAFVQQYKAARPRI